MFEGNVCIKRVKNNSIIKEYHFKNTILRRAKNPLFGRSSYTEDFTIRFYIYDSPISDEDYRNSYYSTYKYTVPGDYYFLGELPPNGTSIGEFPIMIVDDSEGRHIISTTNTILGPQIIWGVGLEWYFKSPDYPYPLYRRSLAVLRLQSSVVFESDDSYVIQYKLSMRW